MLLCALSFDDYCGREAMAAQQIQVKLFTYSVVERKDEIEEVSAAAVVAAAAAAAALKRYRPTAVDDIRPRAVPARAIALLMS